MTIHRLVSVLALCMAFGLGGAPPARADAQSYEMGRELGARTAASAWRNVRRERGCRGTSELRGAIERSTRRIGRAAARFERGDMIDYARGYVHGLWLRFHDVAAACPSRCATVQSLAGAVGGIVYEELVGAVGAVPRSAWKLEAPRFACGRR